MLSADDILLTRLRRQLIRRTASDAPSDPADVVTCMCAMQAQDYAGALWSVGLRCPPETTAVDVERAIAERRIIRTWPLRGTLHLVAPRDIRWMLSAFAPRVLVRATKRHRDLGLSDTDFARARAIFESALAGGNVFTRAEMMDLLEANGVSTAGQRGYHILWVLAQRAVLCCGPMHGKQQTFVLLDEWVPPNAEEPSLRRGEAVARLTARYFAARGPATLSDFAWWAGITKSDARAGLDAGRGGLERIVGNNTEFWLSKGALADTDGSPMSAVHSRRQAVSPPVHLLPGFDEYMLGYADRRLQLGEHGETYGSSVSANGMFSPLLVIDGRIAGTWKRTLKRGHVEIRTREFRQLEEAELEGLTEAAEHYGRFVGLSPVLQA